MLWGKLYKNFGHNVYTSLIKVEPKWQIVHLCFGVGSIQFDISFCIVIQILFISNLCSLLI